METIAFTIATIIGVSIATSVFVAFLAIVTTAYSR